MVAFDENIEEPDRSLGMRFVVIRGGEVIKRLLDHQHEERFKEEVRAVREDCLVPQDFFYNCLSEVVEGMSQGGLAIYLQGDEKPVTGLFNTLLEVLMYLVEHGFEGHLFHSFNVPENRKKIAEAYYKLEPEKLRLVVE